MKLTLGSLLVTGSLVALSGPALAGQPVQLTTQDMDTVTAGHVTPIVNAGGTANAFAAGKYVAATSTNSFGLVKEIGNTNLSVSGAQSTSFSH